MAGLLSHAETVRKAMPDELKAQVEAAQMAGQAVTTQDAALRSPSDGEVVFQLALSSTPDDN